MDTWLAVQTGDKAEEWGRSCTVRLQKLETKHHGRSVRFPATADDDWAGGGQHEAK